MDTNSYFMDYDKINIAIDRIDDIIDIVLPKQYIPIQILQVLQVNNKICYVTYEYDIYNYQCINSNNKELKQLLTKDQKLTDTLTEQRREFKINTSIGCIHILDNRIIIL